MDDTSTPISDNNNNSNNDVVDSTPSPVVDNTISSSDTAPLVSDSSFQLQQHNATNNSQLQS
ncbi:hypothetical protein SAMD00019534_124330, partial [Acytostelium subglobosum LB1]|uniref:hypothetical protein n=1 Tax=Acytostelium subglobosum LB1 TaxID=1410327 RepID=UPI000644F8D8